MENSYMKLDRNVLSGNLHIKEGRMITPEDKDMCVISEELAKQNNLKIGDNIFFNDYHDTRKFKVSEAEISLEFIKWLKRCPQLRGRYLPFGKCDIYGLEISRKGRG